jgi:Trk-type K+ transport system membrane component
LCPKISVLEKVLWAAEKNVNCAEVGWNILWTSARFMWSMVWFSYRISLLIFYLDDLSVGDRGVLKSPTTTGVYICF